MKLLLGTALALLAPGEIAPQAADTSRPIARGGGCQLATVTPEARFAVGGLHRFLFGNTYRELWTKPIRVCRADFARIAGGLKAVEREGAPGSRPFQLQGADGRVFGFRALVKDATLDWPKKLQTSLARSLAKDQISGTLPGGGLAVVQLERAAGLSGPEVTLVVLPDVPRLAEWREDFARATGLLEQRLRESDAGLRAVPGARELLDSKELFERLRSDPESSVDARLFLTARLVDLLVGDWDRHEGQWTWARFDGASGHRWVPVTSDRDWAFTRLDGAVWSLARFIQPKFTKFDARFTGLKGLSIRPMALDRRLLVSLDRADWDSVVAVVVNRLNDRAIEAAVRTLPDELDRERMAWVTAALKQRRDQLPTVAQAFYRMLADVVEVWATEAPDRIRLDEAPDGSLTLTVERGGKRRWSRRFVPEETRELRVYTLGGPDEVVGDKAAGPIRVRIVDEGGGSLRVDPAVRGAAIYDSTREFRWPVDRHSPEAMFRDWGGGFGIAPWIDYQDDVGFILGGGPALVRYGFRRVPYASRFAVRAAYATGFSGVNLDFTGDIRFEQAGRHVMFRVAALGADAVRFYGFGNETPSLEPRGFYAVRQRTYLAETRLVVGLGQKSELSVGGIARFSDSDEDRTTFASLEQPYGFGKFTELGAVAGWQLDARNNPGYPTSGFRIRVQGEYYPAVADVNSAFGVVEAELNLFATAKFLPASPTLALRGGGSRDWGDAPFFEAPAIGARNSVRGYYPRRFTGDGALFGSAEVRLDLGGTPVIPGEWGVYGLGDVGRVYLDGESSGRWHSDWGAGLWFAPFGARKSTVTATYARSGESGRFFLTSGFHF